MIDRGTVAWDTPVAQHLPGFALFDPWVTEHVTIADMYAHRSGLYEHAGDEAGGDRLRPCAGHRAAVQDPAGAFPLDVCLRELRHHDRRRVRGPSRRGGVGRPVPAGGSMDPSGCGTPGSRYADAGGAGQRAMGHVEVDGKWIVTPDQRHPDAQSPAGRSSQCHRYGHVDDDDPGQRAGGRAGSSSLRRVWWRRSPPRS